MDACPKEILQRIGEGKPKHTFACHVPLFCFSAAVSAAFRQKLRELLRLPLHFGLHRGTVTSGHD